MRALHLAFVASVFLGSFLLFMVQPLVARMLLPVYGGSPAVWNTALVFFQLLLFTGTVYAHGVARVRTALVLPLHAAVLLLPLLALPLTASAVPANPVLGARLATEASLLLALGALVAAPVFALATNATLLQLWWSRAGFPGAADPYWLYGASNLASLAALLSYPFLIEPHAGVATQARAWSLAYGAFAILTLLALAGARPWRGRAPDAGSAPGGSRASGAEPTAQGIGHPPAGVKRPGGGSRLPWPRVGLWVARTAVGTSLLMAATIAITTDLAPGPLLWVLPLALYLVTFVLAFGLRERLPRRPVAAAAAVSVAAAAGALLAGGRLPLGALLGIHLAVLFCGALLCHRDLAADRPGPEHLTAYYVWIAAGGALGGVLNALVAPVVFDSLAEMPLTLMALAVLLVLGPATRYRPSWRVGLVAGLTLVVPLGLRLQAGGAGATVVVALVGAGSAFGLLSARRAGVLTLGVCAVCAAVLGGAAEGAGTIARERSFFGVVRIRETADAMEMMHGTTLHGRQLTDPALRRTASAYYHADGPIARLIAATPEGARIGVVGLGTGAAAASAGPTHDLVFYEIDPLVERMARAHFTYLDDATARVSVVLGDGRLRLAAEPPGSFRLLVVDAFSSDFIPVHLLTDEALDSYLARVRPSGLLAFHISNRYVDLRRVLRGYAEARGTGVLYSDYEPSPAARAQGAVRTLVAVLSPDPAALERLSRAPEWTRFSADVEPVRWSDDRADILSVLR